jgi:hypothetical protein
MKIINPNITKGIGIKLIFILFEVDTVPEVEV